MSETNNKSNLEKNVSPSNKKRPVLSTLIFGTISILAYLLIFMNEEWVTNNFTKGNWYTVYPIATAFFFSFVHGAFASYFISTLGLQEKK